MLDLTKLIHEEGQRNNYLRKALDEGKFPSEEVARAIGAEELYRIASDTAEFGIKIRLKLLQSNYHLTELMKVATGNPNQNLADLDSFKMQEMVNTYSADSERLTSGIIGAFMRGYESSW